LAREKQVTLVIQVNGKLRDKILASASIGEAEAKELALSRERVKAYIDGKRIKTLIYVPGKIVNIVMA
jgi:leucyl-tRNA synthetase